jgi:putative hydrolase of the HAD superfamily
MIKTFIFDLGNVIVSFDHNKTAERLMRVCEHASDVIFGKAFTSPLVQQYNLGKITSAEFFETLSRELDLRMNFADFSEAWNCTFAPEPLVSEQFIKTLADKYKLLLLSDTNELHFDYIRERFPALDYFDDFVLSHKAGAVKPSAEIFQAVVKIADCAPEECLFIDDLESNIEGAKKFGINALQFISQTQLEQELKTRGLI